MQQQVAPRLSKIVTVSEASRVEIERYFKIPQKAVEVVYNGTDADLFQPMPEVARRKPTCSSSAAPRTGRRESAP